MIPNGHGAHLTAIASVARWPRKHGKVQIWARRFRRELVGSLFGASGRWLVAGHAALAAIFSVGLG
jgi:hypothetical protein